MAGGRTAEACVQPAHRSGDVETPAEMVVKTAQPGDDTLAMSTVVLAVSSETAGWSGEETEAAQKFGLSLIDIAGQGVYAASGKPYSHQQRNSPFTRRQFAQVLENLACGFRR
ncbi:hypothetical protein ACNKHL_25660 [Shigella flexneri]